MRAVFEGVQTTQCTKYIQNTTTSGSCGGCVMQASMGFQPMVCMNCNQSFSFSIYQNLNEYPRGSDDSINADLVLIVDNSQVISNTGEAIEMNISYSVNLMLN